MDDLTTLLREAVNDVEPGSRLTAVREQAGVASHRRGVRYGVAGSLVAAAVIITGVTVGLHRSDSAETTPVGPPRAFDHGQSHPVYGIYYLGDTPQGSRLYREFRVGPTPDKRLGDALSLLEAKPADPDYVTTWSPGELLGATELDDVIQVEVSAAVAAPVDGVPVSDLSLQQVVYTLQGVTGSRKPVQFVHDGAPVAEVGGRPTPGPVANREQLDVLALVSISNPAERRVVEGYFSADGAASSFEGTVPWQLKAASGKVVMSGSAQSYGYVDRLYPWATGRIDVSGLEPGTYTFVASTEPSGGEGDGPTFDTRTIIIK